MSIEMGRVIASTVRAIPAGRIEMRLFLFANDMCLTLL